MTASLQVYQTQPIAHAIFVIALVASSGLALGSLRYRGICLGAAGVVFAGILAGHFGQRIDRDVLNFTKDFGLVLFVFTIGLRLGPGFPSALREQGLRLNLLAGVTVILGALVALLGAVFLRIDPTATLGLFAGATTNTPSLGAAEQALVGLPGMSPDRAALPALAYAVSYPAGIGGIIASLLAVRRIFHIDPAREAEEFTALERAKVEPLERLNLVVDNPALNELPISQLPGRRETGVIVSRIRQNGEARVATEATTLHTGDVLLAVGTHTGLEQFSRIIGHATDRDLTADPGPVTSDRVVVTQKSVLGKTVKELGLGPKYGVSVTRLTRGDLEMTALPDLRFRFGDTLQVVGPPEALADVARTLGNSVQELNRTQFIPLFIGIGLGVVGGVLPISLPGLSVPVRLGLAGGPLIAGILLSWLGHLRGLVWHVPLVVNLAFRDLGITLFLAAVGLAAGEKFFATILTRTGVIWVLWAIVITVFPLLVLGALARKLFKMNFTTLSGLIAGSTTDTNALAFATLLTKSDAPQVAYATVYPFTMLLRVVTAQVLALFLCG
jgi:putative transport protein